MDCFDFWGLIEFESFFLKAGEDNVGLLIFEYLCLNLTIENDGPDLETCISNLKSFWVDLIKFK